ncbi:MAG: hypothetical protein E7Z89_06325 [Cyanobacteria bacterium SIG28]|nr:hypothetical protein [Cyanobacteria bacterium SIG28]
MLKYAEIIDKNTGLCNVGLGDNQEFYASVGMELMNIEKGFDDKWYLAEKLETAEYKKKKSNYQEKTFKSDFFETSLGWIRRKVSMQDGTTKDFLSDMLLQIKAGLELGQVVEIITYSLPDFSSDFTEDYFLSLQERKEANLDFVKECLNQVVLDWQGNKI